MIGDASAQQLVCCCTHNSAGKDHRAQALDRRAQQDIVTRNWGEHHMGDFGRFHRQRTTVGAAARAEKHHDRSNQTHDMGSVSVQVVECRR